MLCITGVRIYGVRKAAVPPNRLTRATAGLRGRTQARQGRQGTASNWESPNIESTHRQCPEPGWRRGQPGQGPRTPHWPRSAAYYLRETTREPLRGCVSSSPQHEDSSKASLLQRKVGGTRSTVPGSAAPGSSAPARTRTWPYCVPAAKAFPYMNSFNLHDILTGQYCYYSHFTGKFTQVKRRDIE